MPLTVKLEGEKVIITGTLDDPRDVAMLKKVQEDHGLATIEEAFALALETGARHMRFSENPPRDGQSRPRFGPPKWKIQ